VQAYDACVLVLLCLGRGVRLDEDADFEAAELALLSGEDADQPIGLTQRLLENGLECFTRLDRLGVEEADDPVPIDLGQLLVERVRDLPIGAPVADEHVDGLVDGRRTGHGNGEIRAFVHFASCQSVGWIAVPAGQSAAARAVAR
jgi:hypothetical protein